MKKLLKAVHFCLRWFTKMHRCVIIQLIKGEETLFMGFMAWGVGYLVLNVVTKCAGWW